NAAAEGAAAYRPKLIKIKSSAPGTAAPAAPAPAVPQTVAQAVSMQCPESAICEIGVGETAEFANGFKLKILDVEPQGAFAGRDVSFQIFSPDDTLAAAWSSDFDEGDVLSYRGVLNIAEKGYGYRTTPAALLTAKLNVSALFNYRSQKVESLGTGNVYTLKGGDVVRLSNQFMQVNSVDQTHSAATFSFRDDFGRCKGTMREMLMIGASSSYGAICEASSTVYAGRETTIGYAPQQVTLTLNYITDDGKAIVTIKP
ncbi:MAG: hypothetical protein NTY90_00220, partial [Candidatus Micrarchaeota archaeon]|nr:hypothetical protein [Candidatus Micrarchaeota archaeon]